MTRIDFTRIEDGKTLEAGYFHASNDSANARSHLVRQINEHFRGAFYYSIGPIDERGNEVNFRREVMGNLTRTIKGRGPVVVVFEQRSGFSRTSAQDWVQWMYYGMDWSADALPWFPMFYPAIHVDVRSKMEPGLQFVDFMLWAAIQKIKDPTSKKTSWYQRLRRAASNDGALDDGSMLQGGFESHWLLPNDRHDDMYDLSLKEVEPSSAEFPALLSFMEALVRRAVSEGVPAHAAHLLPLLRGANRAASESTCAVTHVGVVDVAAAYLRAFDTGPIQVCGTTPIPFSFADLYKAKLLAIRIVKEALECRTELAEHLAHARSLAMAAGTSH